MCIRRGWIFLMVWPVRPTPYLDLFGNFLQQPNQSYVVFLTLSERYKHAQIDFQM